MTREHVYAAQRDNPEDLDLYTERDDGQLYLVDRNDRVAVADQAEADKCALEIMRNWQRTDEPNEALDAEIARIEAAIKGEDHV